jgi:hypothetical protein
MAITKINLQHFNSLIEAGNIPDFFEQLDSVVPSQHRPLFSELKNEFVGGKAGHNFPQRLRTFLNLFSQQPKTLYILVLACPYKQLTAQLQEIKKETKDKKEKKALEGFEQELHTRYGASPSEWKPYQEETIKELLDIFKQQFDAEIVCLFQCFNDEKQAQKYRLEINEKEENIVLIGDVWTLTQKHNKRVAKSFDRKKTGGCVIPICEKLDNTLQNIMKELSHKIFDDILSHCFHDYFTSGKYEDLGYLHIDLEVANKHSLFRKLNHILNFNAPKIKNDFPEFKAIEEPKINLQTQ